MPTRTPKHPLRDVLVPVLFAAGMLTAACGSDRDTTCSTGSRMARTELLFGLDRVNAEPVSEAEWQDFVDTTVTPLFSDGVTIVDADGQYRMSTGMLVKEDSKVMILLHDGSAARSGDIETIRDAYIERFSQESVLRIDSFACVAF